MASPVYRRVKRGADAVVAAACLIVLSPVVGVAAWAVRRSMGSPVLFKQVRAGRDGAPFEVLKLRTMRALEPGEADFSDDAQRLTPLGSRLRDWSLDELPQLVNVLRGDMSLVGPRPLPMIYVPRYSERQCRRLDVLPGITGLAQVEGRNTLDWDERFEMDVWYVEHQSFRLDLSILLRTAGRVVARQGISAEGAATMREFNPASNGSG